MDQDTKDNSANLIAGIFSASMERLVGTEKACENIASMLEAFSKKPAFTADTSLLLDAIEKLTAADHKIDMSALSSFASTLVKPLPADSWVNIANSDFISSSVIAKALEAVENAAPYYEQAEKEDPLPSLPEEAKTKKSWWTFDRVFALLSLLVTIYFGILQSLPDDQLEEIIKQNEEIIETQQAEIEAVQDSNQELREILQDLSESIADLAEELDTIREQADAVGDAVESADDIPDSESHPDAAECEDQDAQGQQ